MRCTTGRGTDGHWRSRCCAPCSPLRSPCGRVPPTSRRSRRCPSASRSSSTVASTMPPGSWHRSVRISCSASRTPASRPRSAPRCGSSTRRRRCTSRSTRFDDEPGPHHRQGDAARRAAVARRRGRHPLRHLRRRPQRVPVRDQPERRPHRRPDHRRGAQLQPAVGRRVGRRRAPHDDSGWTAELAIPFSTLRFDPAKRGLGLQRAALRAAPRRAGVLGADPARRRRQAGLAVRRAHRNPGRRAGAEPQRQALHARHPEPRRRPRQRAREERPRLRRRPQVGRHARAQPRPDRQHRLRRDGGRRAAGEPHPLPPVLPGEALLLPGERRHLRLRAARDQHQRDAADEAVLLAPHRAGARTASRCRSSGGTRLTGRVGRVERRPARRADRRRPC